MAILARVGEVVNIRIKVEQLDPTDLSYAVTDPDTLTIAVTDPSGTETTYTLAASDVTKISTGLYYYDLSIDAAGHWPYTVTTTNPDTTEDSYVRAQARSFA